METEYKISELNVASSDMRHRLTKLEQILTLKSNEVIINNIRYKLHLFFFY